MKEIKLTKGYVAMVDDADYEWLNQWKWCACIVGNNIYATRGITINGSKSTLKMHRIILNARKGEYVDHRDLNGLNCQRFNMRICTNAQNARNQRPKNGGSSKYKGVSWHKRNKTWCANITLNQKAIGIGSFKCETKAALAYDKKAKELHGEFASLNLL